MSSRLSSLLVQDGHVEARRMAEAFQRQVIYGGTLDTILLEMGLVDEELALEYLARAVELPPAEPLGDGAKEAVGWFPRALAERFQAVPLSRDDGHVRVMVTDPPQRELLAALGDELQLEIEPRIGLEHKLHQALEQLYAIPIPARFSSLARRLRARAEGPGRKKAAEVRNVRSIEAMPEDDVERKVEAASRGFIVERRVEPAKPEPAPEPVPDILSVAIPEFIAPASAPAAPPPEQAIPEVIVDDPPQKVRNRDAPNAFTEFDGRPPTGPGPVSALHLDDGMKLLRETDDRQVVFETLCRMARDRFAFAALFTVQTKSATVAMALADQWVGLDVLSHVSVPLGELSSLRAAVNGRAPYLGRIDDDPPTSQAMAMLGRPPKLWAALLPVVIRDRTVAVLHVDDGGRTRDSSELVDLIAATTEASQAFQRMILKSKAGKLQKAAPAGKPGDTKPEFGGRLGAATPAEDLRKKPRTSDVHAVTSAVVADQGDDQTDPGFRRAMRDPGRAAQIAQALNTVEQGGPPSVMAADALLEMGEEAARALALRIPGNGSPVLTALVPRFGAPIVPHLLPRLADPSPDVRLAVVTALGELHAAESIDALGQRLFDVAVAVRKAAIAALARFSPTRELRALLESLRAELPGPDAIRQRHAADALGELRDAVSIPRLIELVKHREVEVVDAARAALITISKQDFGTSRWRWRSWWERNREESRIEWLLAGLTHREAEVRQSASNELETIVGDKFGYHAELPKKEREEARQKWLAWYKQNPPGRSKERTR